MTSEKDTPNPVSPDTDDGGSINIGEPDLKGRSISPWAWVPSVNFLQGMQYILVIQMFIIVFFTMNIPNATAQLWLGLLSLPWVIKPLWGPLVDRYWTKRNWTTTMQFMVGIAFLGAAFTILLPDAPIFGYPTFFLATILVLFVVAFASATHDIACDGFYMLALTEKQQAFFVGIRSTAFRVGMIFTLGPLVYLASFAQQQTGPPPVYFGLGAVTEQGEVAPPLPRLPEMQPEASDGQRIIVEGTDTQIVRGESEQITVRLAKDPGAKSKITVVLSQVETLPAEPRGLLAKTMKLILPKKLVNEMRFKDDPTRHAISFTSENWDEPQPVVIEVDEKLDANRSAMFKVVGGNVALGWAIVLVVSCLIYFVLATYHKFRMPYSQADAVDTVDRPPFYIPALAVAATILVPFLLGYTTYRILMAEQSVLGPHVFGALATSELPKDKKLYDFLYKLVSILIPTGIGFFLFFMPGIKKHTRAFFFKMSDISRIGFADTFTTFFAKEKIAITLSFILLYRLGEIPLSSLKSPFLLGSIESGGLNMSLSEFAFANSFIYVIALIVGGLFSGWLIATYGLKRIIWILVAFMHLPNLGYVYMSFAQPESLLKINALIAFEAFGYGVGLSAFLMVMIMAAQGPYKTSHYALCTGFMALGVMIPQMPSGFIQEVLGYQKFFIMVMLLVIPGCLLIPFLPIDPDFGKKKKKKQPS
ncbi:MAG: transporter, family, beta-lactamase induction signal transducer AmpG [Candidatus Sumerlaeota bacterium]|nr:transporter, family, beta-lactamase induction signal transducer AmpG [Candidatus Sumerlaeota bacterium]